MILSVPRSTFILCLNKSFIGGIPTESVPFDRGTTDYRTAAITNSFKSSLIGAVRCIKTSKSDSIAL